LTKKHVWVEKTRSGSPGHTWKNVYYRSLEVNVRDLLPCYCYAIKTNSTTIR